MNPTSSGLDDKLTRNVTPWVPIYLSLRVMCGSPEAKHSDRHTVYTLLLAKRSESILKCRNILPQSRVSCQPCPLDSLQSAVTNGASFSKFDFAVLRHYMADLQKYEFGYKKKP